MPFVRICVTGDEERPTPEQKRELISGVTKLVGDVLGKNTSNMVVIIDEIPMENYGISSMMTTMFEVFLPSKIGRAHV